MGTHFSYAPAAAVLCSTCRMRCRHGVAGPPRQPRSQKRHVDASAALGPFAADCGQAGRAWPARRLPPHPPMHSPTMARARPPRPPPSALRPPAATTLRAPAGWACAPRRLATTPARWQPTSRSGPAAGSSAGAAVDNGPAADARCCACWAPRGSPALAPAGWLSDMQAEALAISVWMLRWGSVPALNQCLGDLRCAAASPRANRAACASPVLLPAGRGY